MISENFSIKHIFGLKIRDLRLSRGLSFQELSEKTGLSISYLSEIEKGKKYPKGDKIMQLAEAFGVTYDELVSLKVSKKLQPVINLLNSNFFKEFPLDTFGLDPQKVIELITVAPEKINSFINAIQVISQQYEMRQEQFNHAALRSYQEMHDNYFGEIEDSTAKFRAKHKIESTIINTATLRSLLEAESDLEIDTESLNGNETLRHVRSLTLEENKRFLLNKGLTEAQERFLIAREIGFTCLKLKDRPQETPPQQDYNFETVLNNYKASYFAAALLLPEKEVVADVKSFAQLDVWDGVKLLDFLTKYKATPEMLMQRLTNILPKYSGIKNLFFLRFLGTDDFSSYELTKELHLSKKHNPHANFLNEHYCRRWISIGLIKELRSQHQINGSSDIIADAQISRYHGTKDEYLCLTIAFPNVSNSAESMSVTIGCYIDDSLRKRIKFLNDPAIKVKVVNTTCERCAMTDCGDRIAPPLQVQMEGKKQNILNELNKVAEELKPTSNG